MREQDSTTENSNADARPDSIKSIPTWSCPTCGLRLPITTSTCPQDDTPQDVTEQLKDLLSSNYEFIGTVGTGGMSVIYKARQALLDKIVAIKMLHSHLLNDASIMRFQQEAKAVSRLKHPNVIAVHDFGVSKLGQPYMVMDFIEGKTLADLIRERGAVPLPEAMDIFLAVVDALEHAHEHGLLHRDLKPSNIMLRERTDGFEVILVDFGIAKIVDTESGGVAHQLTLTGEVMGSPMYMSPEQCMGKKVDQRSDIYSLGCVFYEAVAGVPPHRGDTMIETIFMHLNEDAVPLHEIRSDITFPDAFETLVMQLLATKPEDRIQTVTEVKTRLLDIQAGALAGKLATKKQDFNLKISKVQIAFALSGIVILLLVAALVVANGKIEEASRVQSETDAKVATLERARIAANAKSPFEDRSNPTFEKLAALPPTQQNVFLGSSSVTDSALVGLEHLSKLLTLDLSGTHITDLAVEPLSKLHSLTNLGVGGTRMTAAGLAQLSCLTNLSLLSLNDSAADDNTLLAVSKIPALETLYVADTEITDKGIAYLKNAQHLIELDINATRVTNAAMKTLGQMKVKILSMWDVNVTPGGIEQLCQCKTLRILKLSRLNLSPGDLAGISKQEELTLLNLFHIKSLRDDDLRYLIPLKTLTALCIEDCPLTDRCADFLEQMPNLTALYLNRTNITSKALLKIAKLKKAEVFENSKH